MITSDPGTGKTRAVLDAHAILGGKTFSLSATFYIRSGVGGGHKEVPTPYKIWSSLCQKQRKNI